MEIRTVLCPVDFSPLTEREVDLAVEVCRAFEARLVLLHNLAGVSADWSKVWEWQQTHPSDFEGSKPDAEERMKELLARLPAEVRTEAMVTRGPVGLVLLRLAEELPADLVVLGSHGWSSEDHTSIAERLLEKCPCPILTLQEGKGEGHPLRLHGGEGRKAVPVVVPTDFSPNAERAMSYAFSLGRELPLELHLLHVIGPKGMMAVPLDHMVPAADHPEVDLEGVLGRLAEGVPEELRERVECHVEMGDPADEICAFARRVDAGFLVMGEHARGLFRRLFSRDTSRELLHRADCPVWFVPATGGEPAATPAAG